MRILAAELIDGENISPHWAGMLHQVLEQERHQGVSLVARLLVGNVQTLRAWAGVTSTQPFQTRMHTGGRNAADGVLKTEALQLAQQGIARFYLISNDGDFAELAGLLRFQGCQVIGFGTELAAKRWQTACDLFLVLGTDSVQVSAHLAAFTPVYHDPQRAWCIARAQGDAMNLDGSSKQEVVQEAFRAIYGSVQQPPRLTAVLFLLLEQTVTLLSLPNTDSASMLAQPWSAGDLAQALTIGAQDPVISAILEQDLTLCTQWKAILAFACRCSDAYEQGRTTAQTAFPDFPQARFHALHQAHLTHLLTIWCYNPHAAPAEAQHLYSGYRPDHEHAVLLRWFQYGYLCGAESPSSLPKHK